MTPEFDDIQGIVRYGFKHHTEACFLLLRVTNPAAARAILERFDGARRRGLWRTRRNALAADELLREAAE